MSDNEETTEEEPEVLTPDQFLERAEDLFGQIKEQMGLAFTHIADDLKTAAKLIAKEPETDELKALTRSLLTSLLHIETNVQVGRDTASQIRGILHQAAEEPEGDPSAN